MRAAARLWSDDAALALVSLRPVNELSPPPSPSETALDGTSRVWAFLFTSPSLRQVISYIVQDGALLRDTGGDTATYKAMFAARAPLDIELERYLDSDQVLAIARERGQGR